MKQLDIAIELMTGLVAGVDEVGRGPLAGPVVAAAVILNPDDLIDGLADSKQLTAARREVLAIEIRARALCWALGRAEVEEIDRINILQASLLAMQRAVEGLSRCPEHIYVDGNRCPGWRYASTAVIAGDALVPGISAASIIAKVARDGEMVELDRRYPGYGFAAHKGYATPEHLAALLRLGACAIHRRSFRPVSEALERKAGTAKARKGMHASGTASPVQASLKDDY